MTNRRDRRSSLIATTGVGFIALAGVTALTVPAAGVGATAPPDVVPSTPSTSSTSVPSSSVPDVDEATTTTAQPTTVPPTSVPLLSPDDGDGSFLDEFESIVDCLADAAASAPALDELVDDDQRVALEELLDDVIDESPIRPGSDDVAVIVVGPDGPQLVELGDDGSVTVTADDGDVSITISGGVSVSPIAEVFDDLATDLEPMLDDLGTIFGVDPDMIEVDELPTFGEIDECLAQLGATGDQSPADDPVDDDPGRGNESGDDTTDEPADG